MLADFKLCGIPLSRSEAEMEIGILRLVWLSTSHRICMGRPYKIARVHLLLEGSRTESILMVPGHGTSIASLVSGDNLGIITLKRSLAPVAARRAGDEWMGAHPQVSDGVR